MSALRRLALLAIGLIAASSPAQQHPNAVKGFNPEGVYHMNGLDNVNAFNGNLTLSIPIGQEYSLGGGVTYQLRLYANGNLWDTEQRIDLEDDLPQLDIPDCRQPGTAIATPCTHAFPDRRSNAGLGWRLSLGELTTGEANTSFAYVSPDGSEHQLFQTLHHDLPADDPNVYYTRDGTYLRLSRSGDRWVLEFPNGEIHTFVLLPGQGHVVEKITNRHSASGLTVTYTDGTQNGKKTREWTLSDGFRSHTVHFLERPFETGLADPYAADPDLINSRLVLDSIDFAAFGGATARYTFAYTEVQVTRPDWHTIPEPYAPLSALVQELRGIELPDGTAFGFEYVDTYPHAGLPRVMTLPTGGRTEWSYRIYQFPSWTAPSAPHMSQTSGVAERRLYKTPNRSETPYAKWTYSASLDSSWDSPTPSWPKESKTVITDPDGTVTEQYFDVSNLNASSVRYGLPFSVMRPDGTGTRFLSTKVVPQGETAGRSTYLRYEADPGDYRNPRVASTRKIAEDNRIFDVDHFSFDGFGHYRAIIETADGVSKSTETAYNANRGSYPGPTFVMIPTGDPWVTETYDRVTVTKGSKSDVTTFCFDPLTGFLKRRRSVRGAPVAAVNDLLADFEADARGNVLREKYYGGDHHPLPQNATCTTPLGTAPFEIEHAYAFGTRSRTFYPRMGSLNALDLTIDASTGLPSASRDVSGLETTFNYDALGRITELRPPHRAWTSYVYPPPSVWTGPVSVTASQWPEDAGAGGTPLMQARYVYDGHGRLVQESRRVPSGWSITRTDYDALDRRTKAFMPFQASTDAYVATPSTLAARWTYDGFGRVTAVTQPDGATTSIAYKELVGSTQLMPSSRVTRRTSSIRTSKTATSDEQVIDEEETDGFGRLVRVTEDVGGALSATTTYGYGLGDELETVTMGQQTRTFVTDAAGLLRSETHPESGTATMTYDARGHLITRTTATDVLQHEYDGAERLVKVFDDGQILKEFSFYTAAPFRGKLQTATRHNRYYADAQRPAPAAPVTVQVSETFQYAPNGEISGKTTRVLPGDLEFHDSYAYDSLGMLSAVAYPWCSSCGAAAPQRTVSTVRQYGLTTAVGTYARDIEYHPNGLLKSITHLNADGTAGPLFQQDADRGMPRPARIAVANVCSGLAITTNPESHTAKAGASVSLTAAATGNTAWQWYERTASGDAAIAGQTSATMTVTASGNGSRLYFARAIGTGNCTADSAVATVTSVSACPADATISVANPVDSGATAVASVPQAAGATYQWSVSGATVTGALNGNSVTFVPNCGAQTVILTVTVTSGCSATSSRTISVRRPAADVTGSTSISGQSATLTVDFHGTGPWTVSWSGNALPSNTYSTSPQTFSVTPSQTTTYAIATITDGAGCTVPNLGAAATITVAAACTQQPNLTVDAQPASYVASLERHLRFWHEDGQTYEWSITNGHFTYTDQQGVSRFVPGCSGTVTITVKVTSKCGISQVWSVTRPIAHALLAIHPDSTTLTYVPGEAPVPIKVNVSNAYATRVTWSDGLSERTNVDLDGVYTRYAAPAVDTLYTITEAVDFSGVCQPTISNSAWVRVCDRPDATITAPSTVYSKQAASASVPDTPGAAYAWTITGGTFTTPANSRAVSFKSNSCSGSVSLSVTITPSCGAAAASTATIAIAVSAPTAAATGRTTIGQGSSATLQASLTGVAPWQVRWDDQATASAVSTSPQSRVVDPQGTKTYTLASVVDGAGCTATLSGSALVTVVPRVPANVAATAVSANEIHVTWAHGGTADEFEVYRNGQPLVPRVTAPLFIDTGVQPGLAYIYHVVAIKSGTHSSPSSRDVATTVLFGADLVSRATAMTADHMVKLRQAVNAIRVLSGLPQTVFDDADGALKGMRPKAKHITQLRTALAEARARLGLTGDAGGTRTIAAGSFIVADDVMELRRGVK